MAKSKLQNLKFDKRSTVLITSGDISLRAVFTGSFAIGGQNTFNSPFDMPALDALSDTADALQYYAGKIGEFKPISLRTLDQGVSTWKMSEPLQITVSFIVLALAESDDITGQVLPLYKGVYPEISENGYLLTPPNKYTPKNVTQRVTQDIPDGTFSVAISSWFEGHGFIMDNLNLEFSKETIENGSPLYAEGSVTFKTFRPITYSELKGFFNLSPEG
jgi:hypothetical protein